MARSRLIVICVTTAAWSFSFGLGSQLVSLWLDAWGLSDRDIGLNHAAYYLGLTLGSLAVPAVVRRFGLSSAGLGMVLAGLTLAILPSFPDPATWAVLRGLNGLASAFSLVPLETLISRDAAPRERARNFAFYGLALTLGGAIGLWAGQHDYAADDATPFLVGALSPAAAGLVLLHQIRGARLGEEASATTRVPWRGTFLIFGTAWYQGFLEGGVLALLALYLRGRGMSADLAGGVMGVTTVGVVLFQVPISWLADRIGRMPALLGCYAVVLVGLAVAPVCPEHVSLAVTLFLFGACAGAMYPLGLALLGERVAEPALPRAYAWYLAVECVGSQMGAPAMGWGNDAWGEGGMFIVGLIAVLPVLLPWFALRVKQRDRIPSDDNSPAGERRGLSPPCSASPQV